jgi:predicted RNA-binding protein with EMAP domain
MDSSGIVHKGAFSVAIVQNSSVVGIDSKVAVAKLVPASFSTCFALGLVESGVDGWIRLEDTAASLFSF